MGNRTYHPRGLTVHGYRVGKHPLYVVWASMKSRCSNSDQRGWENYGGRGITYCQEWEEFANFANDMWPRPEGTELDRIDNEKGYSKQNCHWVNRFQNAQNKRIYKTNTVGAGGVNELSNGTFSCRYTKDGVRYNLGRFTTVEEAIEAREKFKVALINDPALVKEMLGRRARYDSQTQIRGITKHGSGYIVRKTVNGERIYLGHATDFEAAVAMLEIAA